MPSRLFRPGYINALVQEWLLALDGAMDRLKAGAKVADVGCGHGLSTIVMAQDFPAFDFDGCDFHPGSFAAAHAKAHGVKNVRFKVGRAQDLPGEEYDLVTCFDCLHDMGDPAGCRAYPQGVEAGRIMDGRRARSWGRAGG